MKSKYALLENVYTILLALGVYYIVIMGTMYVAGVFLGTDNAWYNLRKIIGVCVTLPVIYYMFYRPDKLLYGKDDKSGRPKGKAVLLGMFAVLLGIVFSVSFSNLVLWIFPVKAGSSYEQANSALSAGTVIMQFVNSALITPVLEELLYRGIVYKRMRRIAGERVALLVSSLIFGVMHFNLQQFLFATFLGMALGLLMKMSDSLWYAILGHMAANAISICRNNFGVLSFTAERTGYAYFLAAAMVLAGLGCIYVFYRICMDKKNEEL